MESAETVMGGTDRRDQAKKRKQEKCERTILKKGDV